VELETHLSRSSNSEHRDQVHDFLKCCTQLFSNPNVYRRSIEVLTRWIVMLEDDAPIIAPLPERHVRGVKKKRRIGGEFKMEMDLGGMK